MTREETSATRKNHDTEGQKVDISKSLQRLVGKNFKEIRLDPNEFARFCDQYIDPRSGIDAEKMLEYYVSYKLLDFTASDIYMDVAAQDCPFAFFVRDTFGCKVFRQDLYYLEEGIHGEDVGGDASSLPFQDSTISKMSLHNSFEHFEGDSDIAFIQEAQRVLRSKGKLCIVPLFIEAEYQVETDSGWVDEHGKKHLWGIGAQFSRFYDPEQFQKRVLNYCQEFEVEIFEVENAQEMDPSCYLKYFVIMSKK